MFKPNSKRRKTEEPSNSSRPREINHRSLLYNLPNKGGWGGFISDIFSVVSSYLTGEDLLRLLLLPEIKNGYFKAIRCEFWQLEEVLKANLGQEYSIGIWIKDVKSCYRENVGPNAALFVLGKKIFILAVDKNASKEIEACVRKELASWLSDPSGSASIPELKFVENPIKFESLPMLEPPSDKNRTALKLASQKYDIQQLHGCDVVKNNARCNMINDTMLGKKWASEIVQKFFMTCAFYPKKSSVSLGLYRKDKVDLAGIVYKQVVTAFYEETKKISTFEVNADGGGYVVLFGGNIWGWGTYKHLSHLIYYPLVEEHMESTCCKEIKKATLVSGLKNKYIVKVSFVSSFMIALAREGDVYTWGFAAKGQLGNIKRENIHYAGTKNNRPRQVSMPEKVKDIACGSDFAVVVTVKGDVFVWGNNNYGQLGLGDLMNRYEPCKIPMSEKIKNVVCGGDFTMALTVNGNVFSWGNNKYGQLGLGDLFPRNKPCKIQLPPTVKVKKIVCGVYCSALLITTKGLYECGNGNVAVKRIWDNSDIEEVIYVFESPNYVNSYCVLTKNGKSHKIEEDDADRGRYKRITLPYNNVTKIINMFGYILAYTKGSWYEIDSNTSWAGGPWELCTREKDKSVEIERFLLWIITGRSLAEINKMRNYI